MLKSTAYDREYTEETAVKQTPFSEVGETLIAVHSLTVRLRNVVDRLVGAEPPSPEKDNPPASSAILHAMADGARAAGGMITRAHGDLDRLERMLP